MVKLLRLVLALAIVNAISFNANSQSLSVNTTGANADNSAILDVTSTSKGMLVPRMNKTQRTGILMPATGLLVFQDSPDSTGFYYYSGTLWTWLASSNKLDTTAWLTTGNTDMNDTSFIGHRDTKPINFRINNLKYGRIDRTRNNIFFGRAAGHDNGIGYVAIGDSSGTFANNNFSGIAIGLRSGKLNNGFNNAFVGAWSGENNTTGAGNAFFGTKSGSSNTSGFGNAFLGHFAAASNTIGNDNVAIGSESLYYGKSGSDNIAIGTYALHGDSLGSNNVAIGFEALSDYAGSNIVAVGFRSLDSLTTGTRATAIGYRAMSQNTTGDRNTGVGYRSLDSNKVGNYNTALGYAALFRNRASFGTGIGENNLASNTTGEANTSIGAETMVANSSGEWNTAIGVNTLFANTTGSYNTATGMQALFANVTGSNNTANGLYASKSNTSGFNNVAIGFQALLSNDSGSNNLAVGVNSLLLHRRPFSSYNTAVGNYSMENDTSGYYNTGLGVSSLRSNINSIGNTALGTNAMYNHKYNDYNTAIGFESMLADSSGGVNTAIGWRSLRFNKSGIENTAIGVGTLEFMDSSSHNTAVGRGAMIGISGSKGISDNVAIGWYAAGGADSVKRTVVVGAEAGYNNQGFENTFVGFSSGNGYNGSITGIENTGLGSYTLANTTTGRTNTALGIGALYANRTGSNNTVVGVRSMLNGQVGSNNVAVGDSIMGFSTANNNTSIGHFSMRFNTSGVDNVAVGMNALITNNDGNRNVVVGKDAASGLGSADNTTLIGYAANANGSLLNATAIGSNAYVSQNNSLVLGSINTINSATVTTSVGIGTTAPLARLHIRRNGLSGGANIANASLIIEDNVTSFIHLSNPTSSENGILSGNAITTIRAGVVFAADNSLQLRSGGNTTNLMVDNNGYIGIGTLSPTVKLHVHESSNADLNMRISTVSSTYDPAIELVKNGTGADWKLSVTSGNILSIARTTDDFVGVPTEYYQMGVASFRPTADGSNSLGLAGNRWGVVYATNGTINTSDAREKENVENLGYGLSEVMKLRPVSYTWKQHPQWGKKLGFIAQEVQPVLNEVVQVGSLKEKKDDNEPASNKGDDRLGIYYSDLIPVAVKAIQEQQVMIEKQARENAELKQKNTQLEKDIQLIKEKLGIKN